VQTARAAQLRKAAQLPLWWPPRVAPHYQSLTRFMPICYASQLYDRHQKNYNISRIKNITFGHVREKVSPLPTLSPLSDKNRSSNPRAYRPADSMVRDFRGVQFYSPALPRLPARKCRLSVMPYCNHNHIQTKHTPSVDWPTVQQNNPAIGHIYRTVVDQTPAPTPETLTTRTAEVKNLYSQRSSLKMSDQGVLYCIFTDHY